MSNEKPSFIKRLLGAPSLAEGGFVGKNPHDNGVPVPMMDDTGHIFHAPVPPESKMFEPMKRDLRLTLDLRDRRTDLVAEEKCLVDEINARIEKIQAVRKAVRAIDAAGGVLFADEKPYTPIRTTFTKTAFSAPKPEGDAEKRTLEHTRMEGGKIVVEEVELDEEQLNNDMQAAAYEDARKAC